MTDERNVQPGEPLEPFACPHCGQLLAPTCRVCVACGQPIDLSDLSRAEHAVPAQRQPENLPQAARRNQFSWRIFFAIVAAAIVVLSIAVRLVGVETSQLAFAGFTFISAGWVFYDARFKGIPRPWRWSIMTLCFWIVFFPWYVSRRRTPQSSCAVMEAPTSVFFRALFWFVLILLFLTFIVAVVKSPPR